MLSKILGRIRTCLEKSEALNKRMLYCVMRNHKKIRTQIIIDNRQSRWTWITGY